MGCGWSQSNVQPERPAAPRNGRVAVQTDAIGPPSEPARAPRVAPTPAPTLAVAVPPPRPAALSAPPLAPRPLLGCVSPPHASLAARPLSHSHSSGDDDAARTQSQRNRTMEVRRNGNPLELGDLRFGEADTSLSTCASFSPTPCSRNADLIASWLIASSPLPSPRGSRGPEQTERSNDTVDSLSVLLREIDTLAAERGRSLAIEADEPNEGGLWWRSYLDDECSCDNEANGDAFGERGDDPSSSGSSSHLSASSLPSVPVLDTD